MTPARIFRFLVFIALFLGIGGGIGFITNPDKTDFYDTLIKSTLTPPGWVFGVVWPVLYILIGISAGLLFEKREHHGYPTARNLFTIQMMMNWGWSFVFFTLNLKFLAFLWILALIVLVAATMYSMQRLTHAGVILLIPYLIWISFASYLSGTIWWLNKI